MKLSLPLNIKPNAITLMITSSVKKVVVTMSIPKRTVA
jgi:hypothetical protein